MIINNTPHSISIIDESNIVFDSSIRKWVVTSDEVTPTTVIESSGMLNARIETVMDGEFEGVPIYKKEITGCDPLPDDGNYHVVSVLYASAARAAGYDMSSILLVADPVMSPDGKTFVGCRGLAKPF
jgi:hypothetical protein